MIEDMRMQFVDLFRIGFAICFTSTTCGNLTLNILKLFHQKEKKNYKKGCHKRGIHLTFFAK